VVVVDLAQLVEMVHQEQLAELVALEHRPLLVAHHNSMLVVEEEAHLVALLMLLVDLVVVE
jgi:hypothetical protein